MSMKAILTSFPPLGQVTTISNPKCTFTVCLEVDASRTSQEWEVSLWYSDSDAKHPEPANHSWEQHEMQLIGSSQDLEIRDVPTYLRAAENNGSARLFFRAEIAVMKSLSFTVRFRSGPDHPIQPWKWVRDLQGTLDGMVILKSKTDASLASTDINTYIKNLNSTLSITTQLSESPGTLLWAVEAPVKAAQNDHSMEEETTFGRPWGTYSRYGHFYFSSNYHRPILFIYNLHLSLHCGLTRNYAHTVPRCCTCYMLLNQVS